MGYPGYPQQPNWQGGGGYYPQQNYPVQEQGNPALAVITGIIGLGIAGVLIWQTLDLMSMLEGAVGLPADWTTMNIAHFIVAGIMVLGALLVFLRLIAGAFILLAGSVLALVALLVAPLMIDDLPFSMLELSAPPGFVPSGGYGDYFQAMFEFGNEQAVLRFIALVLAVILLITAALPPSLNWLRRPRQNGYSAQQPGW